MARTYRNTRQGKIPYEIGSKQYWDIYYSQQEWTTTQVIEWYDYKVFIPKVLQEIPYKLANNILGWLWEIMIGKDRGECSNNIIKHWLDTKTLPLPIEQLRTFLTITKIEGLEGLDYLIYVPKEFEGVLFEYKSKQITKTISKRSPTVRISKLVSKVAVPKRIHLWQQHRKQSPFRHQKRIFLNESRNLKTSGISDLLEDEMILNHYDKWLQLCHSS